MLSICLRKAIGHCIIFYKLYKTEHVYLVKAKIIDRYYQMQLLVFEINKL